MNALIHHPHRVQIQYNQQAGINIALIGCGGTGSVLAETLCRLLTGTPARLLLVDSDTIEPHNLLRQNFYEDELARPKAEALALRLSRQFNRSVAYSVNDCRDIITSTKYSMNWYLTISCVDNALARTALHELTDTLHWIMDAGNGRDEGQVLLGCLSKYGHRQWIHSPEQPLYFQEGNCVALPAPADQEPDLLVPRDDDTHADRDCAQAVLLSEQGPLINQAMALAAAQMVYKLLTRNLRVMAVYLDLSRGLTTTVPATPANAARHLDLKNPEAIME